MLGMDEVHGRPRFDENKNPRGGVHRSEENDGPLDPLIQNSKITLLQARHKLSTLVEHAYVDLNDFGGAAKGGIGGALLACALRSAQRSRRVTYSAKNEDEY